MRIRGRDIPLTAVLGAIGTFAAWVSVVALHAEARTVGIAWMVVGMVGYFLYRRRSGPRPARRRTRSTAAERPPDFVALELPLGAGADLRRPTSAPQALRGARASSSASDATVDAVYVLQRAARSSRSTAGLRGGGGDGPQRARERARLIGRRSRAAASAPSLLRTRNPGAALVEEARRLGSDVIYLADAHAPAVRAGARARPRSTCSPSAPAGSSSRRAPPRTAAPPSMVVVMVAPCDRPPRLPGDPQDHERDRQADERVRASQADRDDRGAGDDRRG